MGADLDLRFGSGGAALYTFLFLIGLALVLLGFDLGDVDRWLDAQGRWIEAVANLLFRAVSAGFTLLCRFMIGWAIFGRRNPEKPGLGCAFFALIGAYFAWFWVIGD